MRRKNGPQAVGNRYCCCWLLLSMQLTFPAAPVAASQRDAAFASMMTAECDKPIKPTLQSRLSSFYHMQRR
jgi:hypothetical protein